MGHVGGALVKNHAGLQTIDALVLLTITVCPRRIVSLKTTELPLAGLSVNACDPVTGTRNDWISTPPVVSRSSVAVSASASHVTVTVPFGGAVGGETVRLKMPGGRGVKVRVAVGVKVNVGTGVLVALGVKVGVNVKVGVRVRVGVRLGVNEAVKVGVGVKVLVGVKVGVLVGVFDGVKVLVGVSV